MKKSHFAKLKKEMARADRLYLQNAAGRVYISNGHFIAWMPPEKFAEFLPGFPIPEDGERMERKPDGRTCEGINLADWCERCSAEKHSASYTGIRIDAEHGAHCLITSPAGLVFLADKYFDMAADLFGTGAIMASTAKNPVYFYHPGRLGEEFGALVMPCNYNPHEKGDMLREALEALQLPEYFETLRACTRREEAAS